MLPVRTILHPTDFSEASEYALGLASGLAADYHASLVIIHVVASPIVLPDGVVLSNPAPAGEGIRDRLDDLIVSGSDIQVVRRIEEGNPATEILTMAQLCHADLIVMGSHGRHGLSRWLMGSVAEAVMRRADCPVLTVTNQLAARCLKCRASADEITQV